MKEFKIPINLENLTEQEESQYFIDNLISCDDYEVNDLLDLIDSIPIPGYPSMDLFRTSDGDNWLEQLWSCFESRVIRYFVLHSKVYKLIHDGMIV